MKVLHVISSGGMYGAEAVILNLSHALNASPEHRSLIAIFDNTAAPNHQFYDAAVAQGLEAHMVPCRGQIDRTALAVIRNTATTTQADLIHAHGYKADIYCSLAMRGARLPLVSTCHTWYDNDLAVRIYGAIDRRVLRAFSGVVAVSNEVRNRLLDSGVLAERIRLIRNGIDLQPFQHAQSIRALRATELSNLRIGLAGRLAQEKGVDIFLRAAARILQRNPQHHFVVAGEGPDRPALQALIAELGIASHIDLQGHTPDMADFYSSIDVLVSASRQEGLPMAILEGMASGLAPVATTVGAVPQVVRDGETGLLVEPNDPAALAAAIERMIDDPQLRHTLGQNAQQLIAAEYSAERMAAEYLDLYRDVLAETRSRTAR